MISLLVPLFLGLALADQGCGDLKRSECRSQVGKLLNCKWVDSACHNAEDAPANCGKLKAAKCTAHEQCRWNGEECQLGKCSLLKDFEKECEADPFCAYQIPHGLEVDVTHHRKSREECLTIADRIGLDVGEFRKIKLTRFCSENTRRRDCIRARYLAYPERLRFMLEYDVCFWSYNQEACRVNTKGAQYGDPVNTTDTTWRQKNPKYVIADTRPIVTDKEFEGRKYANYKEYAQNCLALNNTGTQTLGVFDGCEEQGCVVYFDENKWDKGQRTTLANAVICAPRAPHSEKFFGAEVQNLLGEYDQTLWQEEIFGDDSGDFQFPDDQSVIDDWIKNLLCEYVAPAFCNSLPGCNVKADPGCFVKDGKKKCYICQGEAELDGDRRRAEGEADPAGADWEYGEEIFYEEYDDIVEEDDTNAAGYTESEENDGGRRL